MKKYIALLRGINISGKNKIPMKELKLYFEELNYSNVVTYINSGNIIFTCDSQNKEVIKNNISQMIYIKYNIDIPVYVIEDIELIDILNNSPKWWGKESKEIYDNLIFIIPPTTYEEVYGEIGEAKKEYERIYNYNNCIFWSFKLKDYSKTNWIKTANSNINDKVTIRTANTIKKLVELCKGE